VFSPTNQRLQNGPGNQVAGKTPATAEKETKQQSN
jgi:hypothetical protein